MSLALKPAQSSRVPVGRNERWNALLSTSTADTIFLRMEWLAAWQRVNPAAKAQIHISIDAGSRQVMASFYRAEYKLLGVSHYGILRPAADCATGAEYPEWPCSPPDAVASYSAVIAELLQRSDWDAIFLPNLADWHGATDRIASAAASHGLHVRQRPRTFAYMELPATLDEYRRSLGNNRRSQLKSQQKALAGCELVRCEHESQLAPMLDALFVLNHKRWSEKGLRGTFVRKPEEAAFYREFAPVAFRNGWLWLTGLRHEGEWAAIQYGYLYNGCYLQMQEGFDPEQPAGAGNILRMWSIGELIARGVRAYDFLGEMTEHKRRWGAKLRMGSDLFVGRRNGKNRLVFGPKTIWPTGRYLRPARGAQ